MSYNILPPSGNRGVVTIVVKLLYKIWWKYRAVTSNTIVALAVTPILRQRMGDCATGLACVDYCATVGKM